MSNYARVGGHAVITADSMPWLTSSAGRNERNELKTRKKAQPKIHYPIFQQCAELETDPFWRKIFERMAVRKFPRSFLYRDGFLTYKYRSKTHQVEIGDLPHQVLAVCKEFLKGFGGLRSQLDREQETQDVEEHLYNYFDRIGWSKMLREVKQILIANYVDELIDSGDYNFDQATRMRRKIELVSTINIGFLLGQLLPGDVHLKDGAITSISHLEVDLERGEFRTTRSRRVKKSSKARPIPDRKLLDRNNKLEAFNKESPDLYRIWSEQIKGRKKATSKTPRLKIIGRPGRTVDDSEAFLRSPPSCEPQSRSDLRTTSDTSPLSSSY